MKNLIILCSLLLFFALSCQKEINTVKSTDKEIITNKIADMDKHLMDFRARMDNPLKSGELLELEQARWYISALLNFAYADATTHYDFFPLDTFYVVLALNNHKVSLSEMNTALTELSSGVLDAYYGVTADEKTVIVLTAEIKTQSETQATLMVVSTMGYNGSPFSFTFDETDWWYWGFGAGKCGDYAGQMAGRDAATQLTQKANISIPVPVGRVYYTDPVTITVHPSDYEIDPLNHPFGRLSLLFWVVDGPPPPPWTCLCPDEMNYYLNNIKFIIAPDKKPQDKVLTNYFIRSDLLLNPHNIAFWIHWAHLTYGVPHITPLPPER
ncbi:MAG: hypothetical protein Q8M23_01690 [Bacteroidales bacterium]|nr:hypothetical protein [Bacteroidales bacterium]